MTRGRRGSANRKVRRDAENARRPLDPIDIWRRSRVVGLAVEKAVSGCASRTDWANVFHALNLMEHMTCSGAATGLDVVRSAQDITVAIFDRRRRGDFDVLPGEVDALRGIADDFVSIIRQINRGTFAEAEKDVAIRVRQILLNKAEAGDVFMNVEDVGL